MRRLSFLFQRNKQDPLKVSRCLNEFTWTISKLRLIIESIRCQMRMMMDKWRHVSKPSVRKLKMMTGIVIKVLRSQNMSWQSGSQKLFMPVQYRTFALKLNKDFLRLWSLLHFQSFSYYLTLNHGQKMTSLALAIARSTSWLNIIWHFWKKVDVT